jgi:3-methyladenine DNA glycosylase AlkC
MEYTRKLTQEELDQIQQANSEYTRMKVTIADLEIQKHTVLMAMDSLREKFSSIEKDLMDKYGKDAVINMKTGEITKKEDK